MGREDAAAFCLMGEMVRRSELTVWASTVALEEIQKVPIEYRDRHLAEYSALKQIGASNATWVDTNPSSTGYGSVATHPDYERLRRILRDENDARLVFQAKMGGVTDFVTVDYKSVLNKASELAQQVGIRALSPSQYVQLRRP